MARRELAVTENTHIDQEEEVLSWDLKIIQRGMLKRRSGYGTLWQSVFVSHNPSLSLSHHRQFDSKKNKSELYYDNQVLRIFLYVCITFLAAIQKRCPPQTPRCRLGVCFSSI